MNSPTSNPADSFGWWLLSYATVLVGFEVWLTNAPKDRFAIGAIAVLSDVLFLATKGPGELKDLVYAGETWTVN